MTDDRKIRLKKPLKEFNVGELDNTKGWLVARDGKRGEFIGKVIPYDQLTDAQLKQAVLDAEGKQLRYHNKAVFFNIHVEKLMDEAERRGLEVEHLNTGFTVNNAYDHLNRKDDGSKG